MPLEVASRTSQFQPGMMHCGKPPQTQATAPQAPLQ